MVVYEFTRNFKSDEIVTIIRLTGEEVYKGTVKDMPLYNRFLEVYSVNFAERKIRLKGGVTVD